MDNHTRPKGKDEVMNAILDAATLLFAERGVRAVSVRDIAQKAAVNHGLVHRHFGSKENLRLQVQNRLMRQINNDIGEPDSMMDAIVQGIGALRKNEAFWKVMARTFLDNEFKGDVQSSFPFMQKMVKLLSDEQEKGAISIDGDPRILVAMGFSMIFGLLVFEGYILPGTGLDADSPESVQDQILSIFMNIMFKKD